MRNKEVRKGLIWNESCLALGVPRPVPDPCPTLPGGQPVRNRVETLRNTMLHSSAYYNLS